MAKLINLFNRKILKVIISLICLWFNSKWAPYDTQVLKRVLQAPRDVSLVHENKAGTQATCWFSHGSSKVHPKYLQIKYYESTPIIKAWICSFFEFPLGQGQVGYMHMLPSDGKTALAHF